MSGQKVIIRYKNALRVGEGRSIKNGNLNVACKGGTGNALDDFMESEDVKTVYCERLIEKVVHENIQGTRNIFCAHIGVIEQSDDFIIKRVRDRGAHFLAAGVQFFEERDGTTVVAAFEEYGCRIAELAFRVNTVGIVDDSSCVHRL